MSILRAIIAVLFILMATGIFSRFTTVRRWGLLLGAATYGTAGILSLILGEWWPLPAGFVVALILGRAGADPPTDLRLDLPTIERSDLSDEVRTREYLNWWLSHDQQVSLVMSDLVQEAWQRGMRRPAIVPDNEFWAVPEAAEAWTSQTIADMRTLAGASRHEFRAHLDRLGDLTSQTLMAAGEATVKYDLPPAPPNLNAVTLKISSTSELSAYAQNYVADAILSARLRVLAWTFQYWHGERYLAKN